MGAKEKVLRLPARSARNSKAAAPSSTKSPTQKSVFSRDMMNPYQLPNIRAVRMKSSPRTASEPTTTVRVVARPTPSGVGRACQPS
ncbi:Uncharacterised protein [Bordetella pertussis]|nr:Uncharacterised protein [Bordetella pertussis]CFP58350.1 Uncharacterised protein [Bordetella pertussis]CFW36090.1 Uncharacterised protein [Bordetella pertussis]